MRTPIERIEELEKRIAELEVYKAMLEEMHLHYEAARKAQEIPRVDPALKPQVIPAGVPVSQSTEELAAHQPGVEEPTPAM